jgi:hypothetical protein
MASRYPRYKAGDPFTPSIINMIMTELERWSNLSGSNGLDVSYADDVGGSPPTITASPPGALLPAQLTATLATGTKASPTSAAATLLVSTGTGAALTTTGGAAITVYNTMKLSASLTSGMQIQVYTFNGLYYLNQVECP